MVDVSRNLAIPAVFSGKAGCTPKESPLLILKTKESNFPKIGSYINEHSGYETSEIVGIKASKVNRPYLDWINSETK